MSKKLQALLWIIALILIGNFVVLRLYGDTLQSTHLFIVRGTVFYPLSWLNLIAGVALSGSPFLGIPQKQIALMGEYHRLANFDGRSDSIPFGHAARIH